MSYDLHGFAEIRIESDAEAYHRYFDNEYRRINTPAPTGEAPRTRITVHLVRRLPSPQAGDLRHGSRFKKLFHFEFLVRGLDCDDVHVYFRRHPLDRLYVTAVGVFLQAQVLEPVLYAKLIEQGVLLMHAAGVTDGEHAYLFPAHGGTGKTTLSLRLARLGYRLLGDDLVLVDPRSGMAYPFARPLHLFSYNLQQMRDTPLPWRLRAVIRGKDVLRAGLELLLREEFLISTRAHVDELFADIGFGNASPYSRVVFLTTSRPAGRVALTDESTRIEMARMILDSADLNASLYANVLGEGPSAESMRQRELEVVMAVLAPLAELQFLNPRVLDDADVERFAAELRG